MSASGSADAGDANRPADAPEREEPPVRKHRTRIVNCVSETGERRVLVYETDQEENRSWIDASVGDVRKLSEMR
jgi:hypothetical protein